MLMRPMNTKELIAQVAADAGVSGVVAKKVLNSTLFAIMRNVAMRRVVRIYQFGTFEPVMRYRRTGRSPRTGKSILIRERIVPVFRPSIYFKTEVDVSNLKVCMTLDNERRQKAEG